MDEASSRTPTNTFSRYLQSLSVHSATHFEYLGEFYIWCITESCAMANQGTKFVQFTQGLHGVWKNPTQIVLDCTEIFIEKPSSHVAQWQTWSEYKHNNTVKLLIGVTSNGTVKFISRLWGGHASDRHITMSSGLIPLLEPGMVVMADKGFTIEYLLPENINLNMPPKIPKARQMTEDEVFNM